MPMNKYAYHILHMSPTVLILYSTDELYNTPHISQMTINCNVNLPCYCHICPSNKYAHKMPYISHMCKLLEIHQWGKCANIYARYELMGATRSCLDMMIIPDVCFVLVYSSECLQQVYD